MGSVTSRRQPVACSRQAGAEPTTTSALEHDDETKIFNETCGVDGNNKSPSLHGQTAPPLWSRLWSPFCCLLSGRRLAVDICHFLACRHHAKRAPSERSSLSNWPDSLFSASWALPGEQATSGTGQQRNKPEPTSGAEGPPRLASSCGATSCHPEMGKFMRTFNF